MSDAGRDRRAKAGKVEKAEERDKNRYSTQTANGRDDNLSAQAAETSADEDARSKQMSALQCERLAAGTTTE